MLSFSITDANRSVVRVGTPKPSMMNGVCSLVQVKSSDSRFKTCIICFTSRWGRASLYYHTHTFESTSGTVRWLPLRIARTRFEFTGRTGPAASIRTLNLRERDDGLCFLRPVLRRARIDWKSGGIRGYVLCQSNRTSEIMRLSVKWVRA